MFVLLQHNNCDVTPHGAGQGDFSSLCRGEDCFKQPDSSRLRVDVQDPQIIVGPMISQVTAHGSCNEGGFSRRSGGSAAVFWELRDPQGRLLRSTQPEQFDCSRPEQFEGLCDSGIFRVTLSGWFGNLYDEHRVTLRILGFDEQCRFYDNGPAGEKTLYLIPLVTGF